MFAKSTRNPRREQPCLKNYCEKGETNIKFEIYAFKFKNYIV